MKKIKHIDIERGEVELRVFTDKQMQIRRKQIQAAKRRIRKKLQKKS